MIREEQVREVKANRAVMTVFPPVKANTAVISENTAESNIPEASIPSL
jgi:hypothetical protein